MTSFASRAKDVFLAALEEPEPNRAAFVEHSCGADVALRERALELLAAHLRAESAFGRRADAAAALASSALTLNEEGASGEFIGPYRLDRELGSGGFGTVWLARQLEPIDRPVAIKLLKAGMDTREIVSRFEAERRALARMDHPGIARILDAGTTPLGRPYFAMEYVDGVPITEHCREQRLDVEALVRLFIELCGAVQHAHTKGVVHRDLKPTNVLVARSGEHSIPKVIDFGIAKAVQGTLSDRSLATRAGQLIGTPSYMAPEQVDGDSDVDTRTDVYGLGALLYELLCGAPPLTATGGGGRDAEAIRRAVLETVPERPSARLARLGEGARFAARDVRGELDWIVLCCLEKDRERRYDSASVLANELRRLLAGQPVLAGPPTVGYRLSRYVRRNARTIAALGAVFVGLTVAVVAIDAEARRAASARDQARASADGARAELVRADAVALFLEDLLLSLDPAIAEGRDLELLLAMLERAERRLVEDASGIPLVEAELHRIVGGAYFKLGRFTDSAPHLEASYRVRMVELGAEDERTLEAAMNHAATLAELGRAEDALALLRSSHGAARRALGDEHERTIALLGNLGATLHHFGRDDEAWPILREVEEVRRRTLGDHDARTVLASNNFADALAALGRHDEAAERYESAYAFQLREKGPRDPLTLAALNNLAKSLEVAGQLQRATEMLELALATKRDVLPPGHPSLLTGLVNLASVVERGGDSERAEALRREAVELGRAHLGPSNRNTLLAIFNLAQSLVLRNEAAAGAEGDELLQELLEHAPGVFGDPSPLLVGARGLRADAKLLIGDLDGALELAEFASEQAELLHASDDPINTVFAARVAMLRLDRGEHEYVEAVVRAYERFVELEFATWSRRAAATLAAHFASAGDEAAAERWRAQSTND